MPWTASTFRKHNKRASPAQLKAAVARANAVLRKTGDEGKAVMLGNAAIKAMRKTRHAKR